MRTDTSREQPWYIDTSDGYRIYGCTDYCGQETGKVVVCVHGLTGHMNEYQHKTAAFYFMARGYDVIRFSFYGDYDRARRLRDCTIRTHAADLTLVLAAKANSYARLYLTGHSYGGPTIMAANPSRANAVSLWDPSFDLVRVWNELPHRQEGEHHIEGWGVEFLIGQPMLEEARRGYDRAACLELSKRFAKPIQVLHAEECIYSSEHEISWHSAGHPQNERHVIAGADHCFYNGRTLDDVLRLTHQWFERF